MSSHFDNFVARFTDTKIDAVRIGKNYFLAEERLRKIRSGVNRDPFSIGLFLGEDRQDFYPSPALMDMLSKRSDSKIVISPKAEWLFLCGRNVLEGSIIKNPKGLKEGIVFVQNEKDENLGYGTFMKQGNDLVVKNLLDKGRYLRVNEKGRR